MVEINFNKIENLSDNCLAACSSLKSIEIPSTIKSISSKAFSSTATISRIIIHRKENAIIGSPFGSDFGLRAIEWVGDN